MELQSWCGNGKPSITKFCKIGEKERQDKMKGEIVSSNTIGSICKTGNTCNIANSAKCKNNNYNIRSKHKIKSSDEHKSWTFSLAIKYFESFWGFCFDMM
jgi:hypothetical protein